jgi:mitochondrial chaperone BCS1
MTTNYRDLLDKALIRPGRIDIEVSFGRADIELLEGLFKAVYNDLDDMVDTFIPTSEKLSRQDRLTMHKEKLGRLAQEFGARVPSDKFTPAEIQSYLLGHKSDPEEALVHLDEWLATKFNEVELADQAEKKAKERIDRATERKIRDLQKKKRDRIRNERKEEEEIEKEEKEYKERKEKAAKEEEDKKKGIIPEETREDTKDKKEVNGSADKDGKSDGKPEKVEEKPTSEK